MATLTETASRGLHPHNSSLQNFGGNSLSSLIKAQSIVPTQPKGASEQATPTKARFRALKKHQECRPTKAEKAQRDAQRAAAANTEQLEAADVLKNLASNNTSAPQYVGPINKRLEDVCAKALKPADKVARTPEHQEPQGAADLLAENENIDGAPLSGEIVLAPVLQDQSRKRPHSDLAYSDFVEYVNKRHQIQQEMEQKRRDMDAMDAKIFQILPICYPENSREQPPV